MWWLLDILIFFRDAEELRTSPQARHEAMQGCLVLIVVAVIAGIMAYVIIAANSAP